MLEITNTRNGAVLNHSNGQESKEGLLFTLEGIANPLAEVSVNGKKALRNAKRFSADILLTQKLNQVEVTSKDKNGIAELKITLVWDKNSFKRYNFYVDDTIFFLTDIAKERPKSLFDHFYLAMLKEFNRRYGTKFMLNIFYDNYHQPFQLSEFPDSYKSEWEENSSWLQLALHAYSEMPEYAYKYSPAEKLLKDYDLVQKEVLRFAGEKTFTPLEAVHWCTFHPDCIDELVKRGVKVLSGWFLDSKGLYGRESHTRFTDLGYNNDLETSLYLEQYRVIYDTDYKVFFNMHDLCLNLTQTEEVAPAIDRIVKKPFYNETIEIYTHEQYSFKYYHNYIADHTERFDIALRRLAEHGYQSVFFNDGLLGNSAWGD